MKISNPYFKLLPFILWLVFVAPASMLNSCGPLFPEDETDTTCLFAGEPCEGFSWSFIKKGTYENIMGKDGQIVHPDSVYVLNMAKERMSSDAQQQSDGYWLITNFSPFEEMNCFNMCLVDSAFSRYYYVYVGNNDWDTMEVHFPITKYALYQEVFYNGVNAQPPDDLPDTIHRQTAYWFYK